MTPRIHFLSSDRLARSYARDKFPHLCFVSDVSDFSDSHVPRNCSSTGLIVVSEDAIDALKQLEHRVPILMPTPARVPPLSLRDRAPDVWIESPSTDNGVVIHFVSTLSPEFGFIEASVYDYSLSIGLTASERRALSMIVAGHSVEESSQRLLLSPRTVEGQLASVRRKAGNRTILLILSDILWSVGARRVLATRA
jgi:DNA-binding CsgD family transcriptional regulator